MILRDLVILSSCQNCKFALKGIAESPAKLGIRDITVDYVVHPNKDPGCLLSSASLLMAQASRYRYCLVVFDREGCGQEHLSCHDLERRVKADLDAHGWSDRCAVVTIDPELDVWVWSDSPNVEKALGWFGRIPSLRSWLIDDGHWPDGCAKPPRPKEALEAALRLVKVRRTSKIYADLAQTVSFQRCQDLAFERLTSTLRKWFRPETDADPAPH